MTAPVFDVAALVGDRRVKVVVTCGTGGVGKTSLSAAMALRAADSGRRVVLVTVDPAKRLATALGLDRLGAEPEPVPGVGGGSLDALMLDMTHTFDEAVRSHAPANRVEAVLHNPFYKALSTSFAGTQDYMATEKLGQLYEAAQQTGRWDLIVVDTPPSRSALDFLDAPARLDRLADGPAMRLLAPKSGPLRLLNVGLSQATALVSRVIGSQALSDLQVFASAFESVMEGFRRRADRVRTLLASPATAFVVVTSPHSAALTESRFLVDRLRQRHQTEARGVIVNQLPVPVPVSAADQARLAAVPAAYAWWQSTWARYRHQRDAVATALGDEVPVTVVPVMAREITDLPAVRELGALAAAGTGLGEQDEAAVLDR
ncbi:MAG: ArsA-related P-loop ATPase [Actinomycetia bacterium]|nr:ArsA-related P-loop ATPase [Actinomycetes bacterium]